MPFLLHLVFFAVVSYVVFCQNKIFLFIGYDGTYNLMKIKLQFDWMPLGLSFGSNPLQEFSNVFMSHNCWLFPCYLFAGMLKDGNVDPVIVYTISSVLLFAMSYVAWRLYGIDSRLALAACWILCMITLPLIRPTTGYQITGIVPHYSFLIASATLGWAFFSRIGKGSLRASICYGVLALVIFLHSTTAAPIVFSLALPLYCALVLLSLLTLQNKRELLFKGVFMALFAVVTATTLGPFLLGTVLNTVPFFFSGELLDSRRTMDFASVLFVDNIAGGALFCLSMMGSFFSISRKEGQIVPFAILNLIIWSLIVSVGFFVSFVVTRYTGPSPRDFEIFFYPLYSLLAAHGSILIVGKAGGFFLPALNQGIFRSKRWDGKYFSPGFVLGVILLVYSLSSVAREAPFEWPMGNTLLGDKLASAIGLSQEGTYKGAVATITRGAIPGDSVWWVDQVGIDYLFTKHIGNDFRGLGLWRLNIPTVFSYNQLMTPQFYAMMTRFLSRPIDRQIRSVVVLTDVNVHYLASLGVRYVIISGYVPPPYEEMTKKKMILLPELSLAASGYPMYVFEIANPNVGTYSPVNQIVSRNANDTVALMSSTKARFNFKNSVVLTERILERLVPADPATLTFTKTGLDIKARSKGTSVLLLPLQYSHCLNVQFRGGISFPRLVRANVMQAALLFTGETDLTLSFRHGPFENQFCRIKDYLDMRRLSIDSVAFSTDRMGD